MFNGRGLCELFWVAIVRSNTIINLSSNYNYDGCRGVVDFFALWRDAERRACKNYAIFTSPISTTVSAPHFQYASKVDFGFDLSNLLLLLQCGNVVRNVWGIGQALLSTFPHCRAHAI